MLHTAPLSPHQSFSEEKQKQIQIAEQGFVVKDDIETG